MLVGLWLIVGIAERAAVFIATFWMLILIGLVANGNPSMLTDPYGAGERLLSCRLRNHRLDTPANCGELGEEEVLGSSLVAKRQCADAV